MPCTRIRYGITRNIQQDTMDASGLLNKAVSTAADIARWIKS
jgi:hypothetical protein